MPRERFLTWSAAALALAGCREDAQPAPDPSALLQQDPRIAELLVPCARGGFYERNVADLVPIHVEKLRAGQGEPLKRAKEELGAAGEEGALALSRFFDEHFADPARGPFLDNALDAASLNPTETAHALLLRALTHANESVRQRAMQGLVSGRARPEDFEIFRERLEGNDTRVLRSLYARALFECDAKRAAREVVRWLREKRHQDVWNEVVRGLAASRDDEVAQSCAELFSMVEEPFAIWVAAPAARAADERALGFLRGELEAEAPARRIAAVQVLAEAGLGDELSAALEDPDDTVRVLALDAIARGPEVSAQARELLASALADASPGVRAVALKQLCRLGDAAAIDLALEHLGGGPERLQPALQALRGPMEVDRALARRALDAILERQRLEQHRPIQQRTATYKALGVVPLREAAVFLRQVALSAEAASETIERLRAHDWLMIQASNTGAEGRAYLFEELAGEADPLRRLDLISAVASARDDSTREALLAVAEERGRSPYEVLFAASRVVKTGPARLVAPRLKRVAATIEDARARSAMQCLLWAWY